jgi:hypothetical protein
MNSARRSRSHIIRVVVIETQIEDEEENGDEEEESPRCDRVMDCGGKQSATPLSSAPCILDERRSLFARERRRHFVLPAQSRMPIRQPNRCRRLELELATARQSCFTLERENLRMPLVVAVGGLNLGRALSRGGHTGQRQ